MSRDLFIEAKREIIRAKSGIHEFQSETIPLRNYGFTPQVKEEIISRVNFKDQLEAYLKYWKEIGEPTVSGDWIIYDEEAEETKWWVEEEYVLTDIVFPESPDYSAIIEDAELEFLKDKDCPIAYIKEKPYADRLLVWIKELEDEDYECKIVRE